MRRWTKAEDEALELSAHLGAERASVAIFEATGSIRSKTAVLRRAQRLGVSMMRYEVCPQCLREVPKLMQLTGLCPLCHEDEMTDRTRRAREALEQAKSKSEAQRLKDAQRRRMTERKRKERARKLNCVDFVKRDIEKDIRRSDQVNFFD